MIDPDQNQQETFDVNDKNKSSIIACQNEVGRKPKKEKRHSETETQDHNKSEQKEQRKKSELEHKKKLHQETSGNDCEVRSLNDFCGENDKKKKRSKNIKDEVTNEEPTECSEQIHSNSSKEHLRLHVSDHRVDGTKKNKDTEIGSKEDKSRKSGLVFASDQSNIVCSNHSDNAIDSTGARNLEDLGTRKKKKKKKHRDYTNKTINLKDHSGQENTEKSMLESESVDDMPHLKKHAKQKKKKRKHSEIDGNVQSRSMAVPDAFLQQQQDIEFEETQLKAKRHKKQKRIKEVDAESILNSHLAESGDVSTHENNFTVQTVDTPLNGNDATNTSMNKTQSLNDVTTKEVSDHSSAQPDVKTEKLVHDHFLYGLRNIYWGNNIEEKNENFLHM